MTCKNCKNGSCIYNNTIFCSQFKKVVTGIRTCQFYKQKNKYNNVKTKVNDITFDSKKEAARYNDLVILEKQGYIVGLERQVKFELIPKNKDERAVYYIADFVYHDLASNQVIAEDVKSEITKKDSTYILKRKLFKYKYPEYVFKEY